MNSELIRHGVAAMLGGGFGSLARFAFGAWMVHHHPDAKMPWATLGVNLAGCLIIGLVYGWVAERWFMGIHLWYFLVTGFLGGFTTFSAFSIETDLLFRRGESFLAWVYILISVGGGLVLAWAGERISVALST